MPKLEDLELKIKQTTANTQGIKGMANALKELATATNSLGNVGDSIKKMGDALRHFPTDSGNAVKEFATAFVKLKNTSQYASAIASSIRQVTTALKDMTNAIDVEKLTAIADAMNKIQDASKFARVSTAVKAASKSADGATSVGETTTQTEEVSAGMEEVTASTNEATQSVYTFKDALRDIGSGAKAGLSAVWNGLKKVGSAALTAGKNLVGMGWERLKGKIQGIIGPLGNLVSSFKRIAMYRLLRSAIKAITTGFAEGTKHVYQWAQQTGDKFVQTMDSMATSAHYLKDSLGAMASPLLDALAPALDALVERFVNLLNVVNQFIAAFTGQSTWRKAVKTPTQYSGAMKEATEQTKKATKAQKELNKALQGFDELNLITTSEINARKPNASNSDTPEVSTTEFITVPVADWIQEIKDSINKGDWAGAGKLLADKLNGMLDSWSAKEFGEKIGQKIQNAVEFYLGFMKNFKWDQFGIKAGDFINGALSKINAEDIGEALTAKIRAALKFLANFTWTVDLTKVGEAIGAAFNSLFSEETMHDLGMTVSGLINKAIEIGVGFITTADFGTAAWNLMDSLFTAIGNINWSDFATVVAKLAIGLLKAIKNALEYALTHIDVVLQALWDFVSTLLGELWNYLVEGIGGLLKEFWQYVKDNFWESGKDDGNGRKDSPLGRDYSTDTNTTTEGATVSRRGEGLGLGENLTKTQSAVDKLNEGLDKAAQPRTVDVTDKNGNLKNASANATTTQSKLKAMDDKNYTFKTIANGLGNAKSNSVTLKDNLVTLNKKTYKATLKSDSITEASKNVTAMVKNLTDANGKTYKIKILPQLITQSEKDANKTVTATMTKKQFNLLPSLKAEGGFVMPSQGSLFVAGEVPGQSEMVGNINGKTGVASGKEITGIADAVYNTGDTEANLLREQNRLLRQILAKNMSVTLAPSAAAGKWVSQSQAAYAKASG